MILSSRWNPLRGHIAATRLKKVRGPLLVVLCYHDLREDDDPANWLRVSRTAFREHLEWLTSHGAFVSPLTGAPVLEKPDLPFRFLLTFDDGYRNNLEIGLPLMERFGVPGLFFISTWHAVTHAPFWFDRVFAAIEGGKLESLDLADLGLRRFCFRAGKPAARWDDIQALLTAIKSVGNEDAPAVQRILERCDAVPGAAESGLLGRYRPLTAGELSRMAESPHCQFGTHGHHHRILTQMEPADVAASLRESREFLQQITRRPIDHVAYPNGDYSPAVIRQCRELGFASGFTTRRGAGRFAPGEFEIPRVLIGGFDDAAALQDKVLSCVP